MEQGRKKNGAISLTFVQQDETIEKNNRAMPVE